MRGIRTLAVAGLLALDASTAAAQATRHFKDSWFWGVKAGETFYQSQSHPDLGLAPLGGIDWLITRTYGGMYLSFDYGILTRENVLVNDSISPLDTVGRVVKISGLRRFTAAGMVFPYQSYRLHPYFGVGFAMWDIAKAEPQGTFRNGLQERLVASTIQQFKAAATPITILGFQYKLPTISVFGQATASPSNSNFFLFSGSGWRTTVEGGVRFNIGSSLDRTR
ncbi:MAG TPA: hypothetical protein VFT29_01130 [Gemmatimonadaceae bacterium]|nr:hypothetical protein [Gemmatimonadaceae bacterium]